MGCSIQRCWDKLHMSAISIHPCKNFLLNNKHLAWAVLFKDAEIICPCLLSAFTHAKIPLHAEHGRCTCAEINTAVLDNLCSGVNLLESTRPCSSGSSFSILPDPFNHLIIWQYKQAGAELCQAQDQLYWALFVISCFKQGKESNCADW